MGMFGRTAVIMRCHKFLPFLTGCCLDKLCMYTCMTWGGEGRGGCAWVCRQGRRNVDSRCAWTEMREKGISS